MAIKTHTRGCAHPHTHTSHMQTHRHSTVLSLTVHLYLLLSHGACLDLTPHLLLTIRKTHTHTPQTHTHLHFPRQKTLCSLTSLNTLPPPTCFFLQPHPPLLLSTLPQTLPPLVSTPAPLPSQSPPHFLSFSQPSAPSKLSRLFLFLLFIFLHPI